jgi:AAA+ superfamily predicted ATPase
VDADAPALERLAYQFALSPSDIAHAAAEASSVAGASERIARAWSEARTRTRRDAGDTVRRIVSTVMLNDLVLPAAQRRSIDAIADQVRHQATVYGTWGMAGASRRGLGITALFSGPSGAGKTTAAEALAGALGLDLLHVDLSQVVSKYIGETSKNLDQVFACAEAGGAVLLFDEADAIFGKRSEVKDSHDRYANMEVSFLLQRMETYRGLAILTTNQKGGMDDAFLRRIRFVVHFPFPDRAMRIELWRRAMPVDLMSTEPDWNELSRLSVAGGSIRNIALNAAFLAAAEGTQITPRHIVRAIGAESAKTESAPVQLQLARSAS